MAEILLFHHAMGQTAAFHAFAGRLRDEGHTVHTPDLYDGRTFATLEEGVAHAEQVGFGTLMDLGAAAAAELPRELVYVGFSLGVVPAQKLAQTREGAHGAVLCYSCVPVSEFGTAWPADVAVQVHGMQDDPIFAGEGDLDAARELVASAPRAELFLYPGDQHYFAEEGSPSYRADAAELLTRRVLDFVKAR